MDHATRIENLEIVCTALQADLSKYIARVKVLESELKDRKPIAVRTKPALAAAAAAEEEFSTPPSAPKFTLNSKVTIHPKVMCSFGQHGKIVEVYEDSYKVQSMIDKASMVVKEKDIVGLMLKEAKRQRRSSNV